MVLSASRLQSLSREIASEVQSRATRCRVIRKTIDAYNARIHLVVEPDPRSTLRHPWRELRFETHSLAWIDVIQVQELDWIYVWQAERDDATSR